MNENDLIKKHATYRYGGHGVVLFSVPVLKRVGEYAINPNRFLKFVNL